MTHRYIFLVLSVAGESVWIGFAIESSSEYAPSIQGLENVDHLDAGEIAERYGVTRFLPLPASEIE